MFIDQSFKGGCSGEINMNFNNMVLTNQTKRRQTNNIMVISIFIVVVVVGYLQVWQTSWTRDYWEQHQLVVRMALHLPSAGFTSGTLMVSTSQCCLLDTCWSHPKVNFSPHFFQFKAKSLVDSSLDNNNAIISLQWILLSQHTCLSSVSMTRLWSLKVPAWFLYKVTEFISLEQVKRRFPVSKNDKHFIPSLFICRTLYKIASICEKNDKKQILSLMSQNFKIVS